MKLTFQGQDFTGDIKIKNKILYVDGHAVMDLRPETEEIAIVGSGNLIVEGDVIIYGDFSGNITASKVIINGESKGDIVCFERAVFNGEINGNITAKELIDNRNKL